MNGKAATAGATGSTLKIVTKLESVAVSARLKLMSRALVVVMVLPEVAS